MNINRKSLEQTECDEKLKKVIKNKPTPRPDHENTNTKNKPTKSEEI